jgi:hypothetical protein
VRTVAFRTYKLARFGPMTIEDPPSWLEFCKAKRCSIRAPEIPDEIVKGDAEKRSTKKASTALRKNAWDFAT